MCASPCPHFPNASAQLELSVIASTAGATVVRFLRTRIRIIPGLGPGVVVVTFLRRFRTMFGPAVEDTLLCDSVTGVTVVTAGVVALCCSSG